MNTVVCTVETEVVMLPMTRSSTAAMVTAGRKKATSGWPRWMDATQTG
jgi:hypothetical protein